MIKLTKLDNELVGVIDELQTELNNLKKLEAQLLFVQKQHENTPSKETEQQIRELQSNCEELQNKLSEIREKAQKLQNKTRTKIN